jgi:hypothetical protein
MRFITVSYGYGHLTRSTSPFSAHGQGTGAKQARLVPFAVNSALLTTEGGLLYIGDEGVMLY